MLTGGGEGADNAANSRGASITPMMEQYIEIKAANPDCLLFYRMGDFYELFFDDAEVAARALGIVLTKRGKHLGRDIPMCGVPVERAEEYLHRLIALGHRVAVCEQLEDPAEARKRGNKSVVRRDVVRLVTPGTLTEDSLLDARRNNYLLALARSRASSADDRFALAWIDISTGEFCVAACERAALAAEIARIEPGEIIVSDALYADTELTPMLRALPAVTPLTRDVFDGATAERRLATFFGVATTAAFGAFSRVELTAAAAAITYVERTQIGKRPPLSPPVRKRPPGRDMAIDHATRSNLELVRTLAGERRGSLLAAIDRTVTAAGSRLLAQRLAAPLTDARAIAQRLDAVAALVDGSALRGDLRQRLKSAPDLARALARVVIGRGGPRDLAAIGDGILAAHALAERLGPPAELPGATFAGAVAALSPARCGAGRRARTRSLGEELPAFRRDGGFVRAGCEQALDEARALRDESRRIVAALQVRYAETTGVRSLKIRHNNVLGYFVDVTAQHGEKLLTAPLNATFIHRQTLAGQVRFTTTELGALEAKIANAADRALALELEIFDRLAAAVTAASAAIMEAAEALAARRRSGGARRVSRSSAITCARRSTGALRLPLRAGAIRSSSRRSRATAVRSLPTTAISRRPPMAGGQEGRGTHQAHHRPEHGRQIDVLAAERAHRRSGADGELRAGTGRPYRRGRSPVLARGRGRRSRARALDLHGRDGRDGGDPQSGGRARAGHPRRDRPRHRDLRRALHRLGDDRASAREQSLPRAVRHAFPRDDRARRQAAAAA